MYVRRSERVRFEHVQPEVIIRFAGRNNPGFVTDVSKSGAGVFLKACPRIQQGDEIEVTKNDHCFPAQVQRVSKAEDGIILGIEFI